MKKMKVLITVILSMVLLIACTKDQEPDVTKSQDNNKNNEAQAPTDVPVVSGDTNETPEEEAKATDPVEKVAIKVAALKGPTAMGMVKIMEDASLGEAANEYSFTIAGAADEITAGLIKGDFDVAAVPCNLASVLYNKTEGKIKLAGINTLGVLYIVETGDSIHSVEDLKGKTIYSTGLGTTPQYTLNYILSSNGIDPEKDVTVEYKSEATEVAAILSESDDAIAMLPQPFVTTVMMNNDKVRIALDTTEEWEAIAEDESSVVTGVVVVRKEFLEENKEAFDAFLEEYKVSAAFSNSNIEEAASLIEKYDIFKAAVAKKAIPYCNITMVTGQEMTNKVEGYLKTLFDQNPQSIGGKLPAEDFYYIQ